MKSERPKTPRNPRAPRAAQPAAGVTENPQGSFEDVIVAEDDEMFKPLQDALHEQLVAKTAARPVNSRVRKAVAKTKSLLTDQQVLGRRLILGNIAVSAAMVQRSVPIDHEMRESIQYKITEL